MNGPDGLIRCSRGGAVCGLVVKGGHIHQAPPMMRRWVGREARSVWRELVRYGWALEWESESGSA